MLLALAGGLGLREVYFFFLDCEGFKEEGNEGFQNVVANEPEGKEKGDLEGSLAFE